MAKKTGYTLVCLVLVLVGLTRYGHAQFVRTGDIQIFNEVGDMTIQNTYQYKNGESRTDPPEALLKGATAQFNVYDDMDCVQTWYFMVTASGRYHQTLTDWCTTGMPIVCADCYWVVDNVGFSVANSPSTSLTHVADWNVNP